MNHANLLARISSTIERDHPTEAAQLLHIAWHLRRLERFADELAAESYNAANAGPKVVQLRPKHVRERA